jgi:tetratricopeptide (TPR) repeat protein
VTAAIIDHLKLSLLPQEQQAVFKRATEDVEAHSHYLHGLHYLWAYSQTGFHEAIACFEQAAARDPTYALAYWGLADAYLQMAFWGTTPTSVACGKVKVYALKALEIDPALGDAHGALSYVHTIHDWDWPRAEREARDAVRLSPKSAMAHAYYSWLLLNTERFDQGLAEAKEALRLDPDNSFIAFAGGLGFMFARHLQLGIDTLRAGIAANPDFYILHWILGEIYGLSGQFEEALAALEKAVELSGRAPYIVGSLGVAYWRCGRRDRSDTILHELTQRADREHVPQSSFFLMHMVRGNLVPALRWLEKAGEAHDSYLSWIRILPWEGVRARGEAKLSAKAKKAFVRFLVGRVIRRHRIVEG